MTQNPKEAERLAYRRYMRKGRRARPFSWHHHTPAEVDEIESRTGKPVKTWFRCDEVADSLGFSTEYIRRLCRTKKIGARQLATKGKPWMVSREGVDALQKMRHDREASRLSEPSVVYFVEREGIVKIGFTTHLKKRLYSLSRGSSLIDGMTVGPVRLLATIPGGSQLEDELHDRFRDLRIGGEWFIPGDELWEFVIGLEGYTGEPLKSCPTGELVAS